MNKTFSLKTAIAVTCLALSASPAHSATIVEHMGANDPATEGWTFSQSGTPVGTMSGGSETTGSGNHDFWQVQDLSNTGSSAYNRALSAPELSGNWTLEASLRIIDSPSVGTAIIVADGLNYWSFYLNNGFVGTRDTSGALYQPITMDTTDDYHNYKIQFSQNGAGTADDTADFFVDGVLKYNVSRSVLFASAASPFIWFGPTGTAVISDARFELVNFNDGFAPIPAPPSIWLMGIGLLALCRHFRFNPGKSMEPTR
jgi:hypothetical protein